MKTSESSGIFWMDGVMRFGQQLSLALKGGFALMKIPFSWRYIRPATPGVPAGTPTVQVPLNFSAKDGKRPSLVKRIWHWFVNLWN